MSEKPWSNNPNAPQLPYSIYFGEKAHLAGVFIGAISYGIVITLFFQCMSALLNPVNRPKGGIKWGLAAHTAVMFSLVTIGVAINANSDRNSFIDNRAFPGTNTIPPGPLGYQVTIYATAITIVSGGIFISNSLLVDGLLLYRCYVIYAMNYWTIAFPCLMYLASMAMGIMYLFVASQLDGPNARRTAIFDFSTAYFSISFSLNVLLTLMIVIRLAWHSRNIRNVLGATTGASGTYKTIVTILVESCALYSINYVLFIGLWIDDNLASFIFQPILGEVQVIAPFLIVLRVAKRTALTNDAIVSGNIGSIRFKSQRDSASCGETLPDENPINSMDMSGEAPGDLGVEAENTIGEVSRR